MYRLINKGERFNKIKFQVEKFFNPSFLEIKDNSKAHRGHKNFPQGVSETHFELTIISDKFEGISKINRHRMVTDLLKEEFDKGLHSLELKLYLPNEKNN